MKTYTLSEEKMNKFFKNFKNLDGSDWDKNIKSVFTTESYYKIFKEYEKISIKPFYHNNQPAKNINFPSEVFNLQKIDATNAKIANKKALTALSTGTDGLCFSNPNNLKVLFVL